MFREKFLLSSTLATLLSLGLFYAPCVLADTASEAAQGDGDPTEIVSEVPTEALLTDDTQPQIEAADAETPVEDESQLSPTEDIVGNELKSDEQSQTAEDAVATITAEGDFVVPTYLLPIDPLPADKEKDTDEIKIVQTTIETVSVPTVKSEADFLNAVQESEPTPEPQENKPVQTAENLNTPKKPLLLPLAPIKELKKDEIGQVDTSPQRRIIPSDYADQVVTALENKEETPFIMPQEVKVTFYPNAVDFSGQTVKWIRAFSLAALSDPRLMVEVRISTDNPQIQEKRLPLIKNVLMSNGLSAHQIQITYANRPADTLILRNIVKPESYEVRETKGTRIKRTKKW